MLKKAIKILGLVCVTVVSACQSDIFYIKGKTLGLGKRDTLILSYDIKSGVPFDTIIVKNERFLYKNHMDSSQVAILYSLNRPESNLLFFVEPGVIDAVVADQMIYSRVSGTPLNQDWQALIDSIDVASHQINTLLEGNLSGTLGNRDVDSIKKDVSMLKNNIETQIKKAKTLHKNDALGRYLAQ